jgi:hypothetical protein
LERTITPRFSAIKALKNYFCPDIGREKFREMASQIETYVDDHNFKDCILGSKRTVFSVGTIREIAKRGREYGLLESARRLLAIARVLLLYSR